MGVHTTTSSRWNIHVGNLLKIDTKGMDVDASLKLKGGWKLLTGYIVGSM